MASIPTLTDRGVTLRAPEDDDIPGSVEQCLDPVSQQWTTAPVPYTPEDARTYLRHIIPSGWETDREWGFVVEAHDADRGGARRFAGTISLRNLGDGRAEVAYGAHPWARGKGIIEDALRQLVRWGFEERDLQSLVWLARRGNWASRRLAWRLGFTFEGTLRDWLPTRDGLGDAWAGTLRRGELMEPRSPWLEAPTLHGSRVMLRALHERDLERIVETRSDWEVQRWLQSPRESAPHTLDGTREYLLSRAEEAAAGRAVDWAIADPETDAYLGQVSLFDFRPGSPAAELGYWAHPRARRRGWTTEAARMVVRHCFVPVEDGGLGLHRVTAVAAVGNDASHRVLERAGFVRSGRERSSMLLSDGTWVDAVVYDQLAGDRDRHDW
jgi:RimJ/RimL family protein N-acetyltransferase